MALLDRFPRKVEIQETKRASRGASTTSGGSPAMRLRAIRT
jgi:hypothetical protein